MSEPTPVSSLAGHSVDPDPPRRLLLRPTARGEFEIVAQGILFGELMPSGREGFVASGACMGEEWDLAYEGPSSLAGRVVARVVRPGEDGDGAVFEGRRPTQGRVTLPDGERLTWGVPPSLAALKDARGQRLLRYRTPFWPRWRRETWIHVHPGAWRRPVLPRLVLLTAVLRLHAEVAWFWKAPFPSGE